MDNITEILERNAREWGDDVALVEIDKCEGFKAHPDPRVAQEAKNALADLKWTQATF